MSTFVEGASDDLFASPEVNLEQFVSGLETVMQRGTHLDAGGAVRQLVRPTLGRTDGSFVAGLALLRRLPQRSFALRLANDVEAQLPRGKAAAAAVAFAGDPPADLVLAVQKITASDVQASSVIKLKNIYAADNPPSVEYLRTARFVEALIKNVFGAEQTDNSMIDEKIWLLAYVASVRESWTEDNSGPIERNTDMLKPTIDSLHYAYTIFPKLTPDIDLRHEFKNLLDCVRFPIVAAGLLYWISTYISDRVFYESNALISTSVASEPILIFELLEEIAIVHPLQRTFILEKILGEAILRGYDRLSPLIALEVRKKFMDRLVFLLKLGFVISSLEFMLANCEKMDDALLVYFLRQIHDNTSGPYHYRVIDLLVNLVSKMARPDLPSTKDLMLNLLGTWMGNIQTDLETASAELLPGLKNLEERLFAEQEKLTNA